MFLVSGVPGRGLGGFSPSHYRVKIKTNNTNYSITNKTIIVTHFAQNNPIKKDLYNKRRYILLVFIYISVAPKSKKFSRAKYKRPNTAYFMAKIMTRIGFYICNNEAFIRLTVKLWPEMNLVVL